MEEMYSAIDIPFSLGSLIYDNSNSVIKPCKKDTELIANSPNLPLVSIVSDNIDNSSTEITITTVSLGDKEINERESLFNLVTKDNNPCTATKKNFENLDMSEPQTVVSEESYKKMMNEEQSTSKRSNQIGFFDFLPVWGVSSIRGRMFEMEDSVATLPLLLRIPVQMLSDNHISNPKLQNLSHFHAHFFGVYDGHGGSQVANYCRDRIHLALAEEIESANKSLHNGKYSYWQDQWQKTFVSCFRKIDAEVGGFCNETATTDDINDNKPEPVASEAIGSTAVVSIVCPTHIIVANSGDSRAVLCRGKAAVPLSVDHKPNREDELSRIEAAGGKVIYWDGYRVLGVLAMSRSIGDRYLKPYVIPDPEVMFVSRQKEDECLILASDGLWDVMTNEEACDLARRRILQWHKKKSENVSVNEKGAAQDASEFLSRTALQRGSSDNVSVIVVDLKAQRKFKKKT